VFNAYPEHPNLNPVLPHVLTVLLVNLNPLLVVPHVIHALLVPTRTQQVNRHVCHVQLEQLKPPTDSPLVLTVWQVALLGWGDSPHVRTAQLVPQPLSTHQQAA
jgi:urea transporter